MSDLEKNPIVLDQLIREIGIARFQGRVNSGLIDPYEGAKAMQRFVDEGQQGGMLSKLAFLWRSK